MDNERLMGIGLTLLTIALWIGPIAIAFSSHGWDVKETILPPGDQREDIKDEVEGVINKAENIKDYVEVVDREISKDNVSFTINIEPDENLFGSTIFDTIKIKKMKANLLDNQDNIVPLELEKKKEIEAGVSENITLSGEPTDYGENLILSDQFEGFKDIENIKGFVNFELADLSIKFSLDKVMGGGSSGEEGSETHSGEGESKEK